MEEQKQEKTIPTKKTKKKEQTQNRNNGNQTVTKAIATVRTDRTETHRGRVQSATERVGETRRVRRNRRRVREAAERFSELAVSCAREEKGEEGTQRVEVVSFRVVLIVFSYITRARALRLLKSHLFSFSSYFHV